ALSAARERGVRVRVAARRARELELGLVGLGVTAVVLTHHRREQARDESQPAELPGGKQIPELERLAVVVPRVADDQLPPALPGGGPEGPGGGRGGGGGVFGGG